MNLGEQILEQFSRTYAAESDVTENPSRPMIRKDGRFERESKLTS